MRIVRKNSNYIVYLKKEIEIAAKEAGVDYATACDILDNFFLSLRVFLADPRLPTIRIGRFGYFQTTLGGIRKYIMSAINSYRREPTLERRSILFDKLSKVWKVRNRILNARKKLSDGVDWNKLDPSTYQEDEAKRIFADKYKKYYEEDGKRKSFKQKPKKFKWD